MANQDKRAEARPIMFEYQEWNGANGHRKLCNTCSTTVGALLWAGLHGLHSYDAIYRSRVQAKLLVPTFTSVGSYDHVPSVFETGVLFVWSRYLDFVSC